MTDDDFSRLGQDMLDQLAAAGIYVPSRDDSPKTYADAPVSSGLAPDTSTNNLLPPSPIDFGVGPGGAGAAYGGGGIGSSSASPTVGLDAPGAYPLPWETRYPNDLGSKDWNPYDEPPAVDEEGNITNPKVVTGAMLGAAQFGNPYGLGGGVPPALVLGGLRLPEPPTMPHSEFYTGQGAPREPGAPVLWNYDEAGNIRWPQGISDPMARERGPEFPFQDAPPPPVPGTMPMYRGESTGPTLSNQIVTDPRTGFYEPQFDPMGNPIIDPVAYQVEHPTEFRGRWFTPDANLASSLGRRGEGADSQLLRADVPIPGAQLYRPASVFAQEGYVPPRGVGYHDPRTELTNMGEYILPPALANRAYPLTPEQIRAQEFSNYLNNIQRSLNFNWPRVGANINNVTTPRQILSFGR